MIGVRGHLSGCILALAAWVGLAVPALAQDNSGLAVGKDAWARASCFNCHGSMAQGGSGGDYPVGPSLRNISFDKETRWVRTSFISRGCPAFFCSPLFGRAPSPSWVVCLRRFGLPDYPSH